jgi:20S proteasome alpha/beta subunit
MRAPLSHWPYCFCEDSEGTWTPQSELDMTLTYALISDGGIVLCADSEEIFSHYVSGNRGSPTYAAKKSKIRVLENGSAFSIAGNAGLVGALLAKADLEGIDNSKPFDSVVREYSSLFQREFLREYGQGPYRVHCAFLFCGYIGTNEKKIPQIVKLSDDLGFSWNPVATSEGYGFTGREQHGGVLYLHHRLYSPGLPLDSAKCLAYCILSEVADLDNIVGPPIEMAIITESGTDLWTDFKRYEQKRHQIIGAVRSLIHSA